MVVGNILLGTIFGFCAFLLAWTLGVSFWPSLAIYFLAGIFGTVIVPLFWAAKGILNDSQHAAFAGKVDAGTDQKIGGLRTPSIRILAVDDDPFILELIPLIASKAGFDRVTAASSGEDALNILEAATESFDCMLFDISMPGIDGVELCKRVRTIPQYRDTPIIMLTAMRDLEHLQNAFQAGATDFTTKPFDIGDLGERLNVAQEATDELRAGAAKIEQSDRLQILGLKNLLSVTALGNYVRQIPRAALSKTQICAVKVDQFDTMFREMAANELTHSLGTVCKAVDAHFEARDGMMAYAGNGIFLVVSNSDARPSSGKSETMIQNLLCETGIRSGKAGMTDCQISVGPPIAVDAYHYSTAFERVASLVEARRYEKCSDGLLPDQVANRR